MKDEKFQYFVVSLKNPIFRGRAVLKKPIYREELPQNGAAWTVSRFKEGILLKKERLVFLRGGLKPQCTLWGRGFKAVLLRKAELRAKVFHQLNIFTKYFIIKL